MTTTPPPDEAVKLLMELEETYTRTWAAFPKAPPAPPWPESAALQELRGWFADWYRTHDRAALHFARVLLASAGVALPANYPGYLGDLRLAVGMIVVPLAQRAAEVPLVPAVPHRVGTVQAHHDQDHALLLDPIGRACCYWPNDSRFLRAATRGEIQSFLSASVDAAGYNYAGLDNTVKE